MKRILTQKDNPIPACAVDNCAEVEDLKPIPPEVNRRVRTSAAMIGLAISMGASSLLLPRQSDGAMAAEPTDSSAVPTVPAPVTEAAPTPTPEVKSVKTTAVSTLKPLGLGHKVQEINSISSATRTYRVKPRTFTQPIAESGTATFNPQSSRFSPPAQTTISALKASIHELKAGDRGATQSEFYGVAPNRLGQSAAQEASEPVTVPGYVDEQLKVKQAVALNRLKESSNRLRSSLAEWKSEESTNYSLAQGTELTQPTVIPSLVKPLAEKPSRATERFNRLPKAAVPVSTGTAPEVLTNNAQLQKLRQEPVGSDVPQLVLPAPVETTAPVSLLYQVKPGDTLGEIARDYGVSPTVLAQANELSNPNRLKVSQLLAIPPSQSISSTSESVAYVPPAEKLPQPEPLASRAVFSSPSVGASTPTLPVVVSALPPSTEASRDEGPTVPLPKWEASQNGSLSSLGTDAPSQKFTGELATVPTQSSALTKQLVVGDSQRDRFANRKSVEATASEVPEAFEPENSAVVADSAVKASSDPRNKQQHYSPYVERLRAEIFQLREQYRTQQGSEIPSQNAQRNPAAPLANSASGSYEPVNPEFNPNRYNEALQAEIRKRSEQQPARRVQTRTSLPEPSTTRSRTQQQILATAPAGPEAYQPFNQTLPGRLVAPDLPPLNAPDNYLPNGINQNFNGYIWPTKGLVTSGYGRRWGRMHKGIDIAAPTGTPIFAAAPGVVVYARYNRGGYGNLVDIKHPDGSLTRYAHNSRIFVQEGQYVDQGQHIAAMGSTGRSTGPHCHFEVHTLGRGAVNPVAFLPRR